MSEPKWKGRIAELEAEIKHLRAEVTDIEVARQRLIDEVMRLKLDNDSLRAALKQIAAGGLGTHGDAEVARAALEQDNKRWRAEVERLRAEVERLKSLLAGLLSEWDKLTRYGSPMAKAANPRVSAARAALEGKE